jgi:hypothetical protein
MVYQLLFQKYRWVATYLKYNNYRAELEDLLKICYDVVLVDY